MKGYYARESATASDFVIVEGEGKNTFAWTAPRGCNAKWRNGWTQNPENVEIYKSWEHANAAIERYRKMGRVQFANAKYCTFGEWRALLRGESLD